MPKDTLQASKPQSKLHVKPPPTIAEQIVHLKSKGSRWLTSGLLRSHNRLSWKNQLVL